MIWIAAAVVVATLIASVAYAYPKVAFLALQSSVIDKQFDDAEKTARLLEQLGNADDSGTYI